MAPVERQCAIVILWIDLVQYVAAASVQGAQRLAIGVIERQIVLATGTNDADL